GKGRRSGRHQQGHQQGAHHRLSVFAFRGLAGNLAIWDDQMLDKKGKNLTTGRARVKPELQQQKSRRLAAFRRLCCVSRR
ncbi:MAG: hypothetical protein LRY55_01430, partial [Leadbetterella sp.]|nr:hypothetical protein [Leadbetterella sp.]